MQTLTLKQSKYAELVSEGANQTAAYRAAYNTVGMQAKTVWEDASRLRRNPKVAARIEELQTEKEARRRMQRLRLDDYVIEELMHLAAHAESCSVRVRALKLLGKHLGLFKPKKVVRQAQRTSAEIKASIDQRLHRLEQYLEDNPD